MNVINEFLEEWLRERVHWLKDNYVKSLSVPKLVDYLSELLPDFEYYKKGPRVTGHKSISSYWDTIKTPATEEVYERAINEYNSKYARILKGVPAYLKGVYKWEVSKVILENERAEIEDKKRFLQHKIRHYCGEVTDARNLTIGYDSGINGIITGVLGRVKIETILAGGYNIQRLHLRVLVHPLDGQDRYDPTGKFDIANPQQLQECLDKHLHEVDKFKPENYKEVLNRIETFKFMDWVTEQPNCIDIPHPTLPVVRQQGTEKYAHMHYIATPFSLLEWDTNKKKARVLFLMGYDYYQMETARQADRYLTSAKVGALATFVSFGHLTTNPKYLDNLSGDALVMAHTKDVVAMQNKRAFMKYDTSYKLSLVRGEKETLIATVKTPVRAGLTELFTSVAPTVGREAHIKNEVLFIDGQKFTPNLEEIHKKVEFIYGIDFNKGVSVRVLPPENPLELYIIQVRIEGLKTGNITTYRSNLTKVIELALHSGDRTLEDPVRAMTKR